MIDAAAPATRPPKAPKTALDATRSFWLKQLHQWRWISAALSLVGLLMFAVTGVILNHAAQSPVGPITIERTATLSAPLLARPADFPAETTGPVPDGWLTIDRATGDAEGVVAVTWPEAGTSWLNAVVRYSSVVEVLP